MDKIEKVLAPFANALNNNKIIQTIAKAAYKANMFVVTFTKT